MTADSVLISRGPGETRVALLSAGRLKELLVAREGALSVAGNVYLGRVEAVKKGIEAAFVDIGLGRSGFLALAEARPVGSESSGDHIGDYVNEGDAVLVQVLRDPAEDKGAKLTTRVNLAGVNLVFRPGHPGVSVSRRIEDEGERDRLTAAIEALAPLGGGFIVRTAASGVAEDALGTEARALNRRWKDIYLRRANAKAPSALSVEPGPALRVLRDHGPGIERIVADDPETLNEVREYCHAELPALSAAIQAHQDKQALFEAFGVEEQIDEALSPAVALPGGGSLIISQTPALCAIDVNTGGARGGAADPAAQHLRPDRRRLRAGPGPGPQSGSARRAACRRCQRLLKPPGDRLYGHGAGGNDATPPRPVVTGNSLPAFRGPGRAVEITVDGGAGGAQGRSQGRTRGIGSVDAPRLAGGDQGAPGAGEGGPERGGTAARTCH